MKVFIVEDELNNVNGLKRMLLEYTEGIEYSGFAQSVKDAVAQIQSTQPDCILLDIQLPDGTGFDVLQQLTGCNPKVIFVTAFDSYAIKAFKFSAIDYLLKPVDKDELIAALKKASPVVFNSLHPKLGSQKGKLPLPTIHGIMLLEIKDIVRCEASDNYSKIVMGSGKEFIASKTLSLLEEFLHVYGFLRVHRTHLINPDFVTFLEKGKNALITLSNGQQVPWSESYRKVLTQVFGQL